MNPRDIAGERKKKKKKKISPLNIRKRARLPVAFIIKGSVELMKPYQRVYECMHTYII